MQLEDTLSANDSEIYFASARLQSSRRDAVSIGDHFWSSLGHQGRCYLLRLDALFIPMRRRPQSTAISRMASVSVFYPTSYASHDVNYALRLKRVCAQGELGAASVGFHRIFTPPADYELLRHPRPLTMSLKDFFECIGPDLEKHSPEAWSKTGLELPDFMASSGQRPRKSGKARVLVMSVSAFNRMQRSTFGHRLFGWSREDALQCVGDNRLFQCPCGTRLFFCRRKHPLYHVNRHAVRQESLAPRRKGHLQHLSLRTEHEALNRFNLRCESPPPPLSQGRRKKSAVAEATAAPEVKAPKQEPSPLPPQPPPKRRGRRRKTEKVRSKSATVAHGKQYAEDDEISVVIAGKRKRRRQSKRRLSISPSLSPPSLSPAATVTTVGAQLTPQLSPAFSPKRRRLQQRRRSRQRLTTIDDIAVTTAAATVDSVIATVLNCDSDRAVIGDGGSGNGDGVASVHSGRSKAPQFEMCLETISPPSSPHPAALASAGVSQPALPLPSTSAPDIDFRLHRHHYFQQLQHHQFLQSQQRQHQQPDLFRLQQRDFHNYNSIYHYHQQQQQQLQSYLQRWPAPPVPQSLTNWPPPPLPGAIWPPQKPQQLLSPSGFGQSCMTSFLTLPQPQPQSLSLSPQLPTRMPPPPPLSLTQAPQTPQPPGSTTLVPIIITNPMALSAAGLLGNWPR